MLGNEIYALFLDTVTASAALLGIFITLWFGLRKKIPFAILDISLSTHTARRTGKMRQFGPANEESHYLILKIENLRDTPMQAFSASIDADHSKTMSDIHITGMELSEPEIFIPPKSIYEVQYRINSKSVVGTYSQAKDLRITLKTSFGDKTVPFPGEYFEQLYQITEEPWLFNSKPPFEAA